MKKSLALSRVALDKLVALGGIAVVFVQMVLIAYSPIHVFVVAGGVIMIYVGIWRVASHMLPDRRRHGALRAEVDHFMALVRQLNAQKLSGASAIDDTKSAIHATVDRIVDVAGVVDQGS